MKKLPYEWTTKVQSILDSDMSIDQKVHAIYMYDYDMACMCDSGVPKASMSKIEIKEILMERER